jgi:hypothetical protein
MSRLINPFVVDEIETLRREMDDREIETLRREIETLGHETDRQIRKARIGAGVALVLVLGTLIGLLVGR